MWPLRIERIIEAIVARLGAIQEAIQHHERAVRDASEAAEQNRADIPRSIAALQPTEATTREDRTYRQKNYRVQVILTIGTWFAFLAAAVYAGIAAKQLWVMNQTFHEMQDQTYVSCLNAQAAQRQGSDNRIIALAAIQQSDAAIVAQRPVIAVTFLNPQMTPDDPRKPSGSAHLMSQFQLKNEGHSNATNAWIQMVSVLLPTKEPLKFTYPPKLVQAIKASVIGQRATIPNGDNPHLAFMPIGATYPDGTTIPGTQNFLRELFSSNVLWQYGKVTYDDFSGSHWQHFCFGSIAQTFHKEPIRMQASPNEKKCTDYNQSGDNYKKTELPPVTIAPEISCKIPKPE